MMRRIALVSVCAALVAACGGESSGGTAGGGGSAGAAGAGGAGGAGGSEGGSGGGGITFGSVVILGDSISDGGGQSPFFYDLLVSNDDAAHPDLAGKDLSTLFPGIQVVREAVAGAVSGGLASQIQKLPDTLPGPVLVTITIGGNDMQANALDIIQGNDAEARAGYADKVEAALADLTAPDRFGPGVEVVVLQASIYDPTSGAGDFAEQGCPGILGLFPVTPSDEFFNGWNAAAEERFASFPSAYLLDAHGAFYPHPLGAPDTWYAGDCIHPNAVGHDGMRRVFWEKIEALATGP